MTTYMQEELEACMEEKPLNTNVKVCYDRFNSLYNFKIDQVDIFAEGRVIRTC